MVLDDGDQQGSPYGADDAPFVVDDSMANFLSMVWNVVCWRPFCRGVGPGIEREGVKVPCEGAGGRGGRAMRGLQLVVVES